MWNFFSRKTKEFGNFSPKSIAVFLKFWRQNRILAEKYQHSCQNSTLHIRRDLLGKHMFSRKKSNDKFCSDFQRKFSFFCRFLGWQSKRRLCAQMNECFEGLFFFFEKKESFCVFFSSWVENCHTLAMNLQPTVKMRFFCLEELFQGDCFFSEKKVNSLVFSLKKWAEPFKKLKTMNFWQKISARLSELESTLPEGLLAEFFFAGKNHLQKRFRSLSGSSLCFVEKYRQIREKCITASRWICWGKVRFLWRNNGLHLFFGRWEEKCRTLAKNQPHCQVCVFICLINLFQEEIFSWKKQTFCYLF